MRMDIDQVADLARLDLSQEEKVHLSEQLGAILEYVDQLRDLDTTDVPETCHVLPLATPFRRDERGAHLSPEDALSNAPKADGTAFVVPRVI